MHYFPYCDTCGTRGHTAAKCPARQVQEAQEKQELIRLQNARLGLTPELEAEILMIRRRWRAAVLLCARDQR